jgi:hypothetical protein
MEGHKMVAKLADGEMVEVVHEPVWLIHSDGGERDRGFCRAAWRKAGRVFENPFDRKLGGWTQGAVWLENGHSFAVELTPVQGERLWVEVKQDGRRKFRRAWVNTKWRWIPRVEKGQPKMSLRQLMNAATDDEWERVQRTEAAYVAEFERNAARFEVMRDTMPQEADKWQRALKSARALSAQRLEEARKRLGL